MTVTEGAVGRCIMIITGATLMLAGIAIEIIGAMNNDPMGLFVPATTIAVSGGALLGGGLGEI